MDKTCCFFMGANSSAGFFSLFQGLDAEVPACRLYCVKGGPGCGKSTAITRLSTALTRPGERTETLLCSSDPGSLDGAILHGRGLALVDGTAPHVTDPTFPGATGGYITFPPFLDLPGLEAKGPALLSLKARSGSHYAQAYRLIAAACRIEEGLRAKLAPMLSLPRLLRRTAGVLARELPRTGPQTGGPGALRLRFLDGVTPEGQLCLWGTVAALAGRVYVFEDTYGLAEPALAAIRDAAVNGGWETYACLCPKNPHRVRHVILPQLGLAFVSDDGSEEMPLEAYRRIRVDAYVDMGQLRPMRGKLRLLHRTARSLMDDAVAEIAAAHTLHDEMEALYRPHLNLAALDAALAETEALLGS